MLCFGYSKPIRFLLPLFDALFYFYTEKIIDLFDLLVYLVFISAKDSSKFTIALHHSGKFDYMQNDLLVYSGGNVDFVDYVDPDFMSIHEIILIAK